MDILKNIMITLIFIANTSEDCVDDFAYGDYEVIYKRFIIYSKIFTINKI
jgi:hypothetical protein